MLQHCWSICKHACLCCLLYDTASWCMLLLKGLAWRMFSSKHTVDLLTPCECLCALCSGMACGPYTTVTCWQCIKLLQLLCSAPLDRMVATLRRQACVKAALAGWEMQQPLERQCEIHRWLLQYNEAVLCLLWHACRCIMLVLLANVVTCRPRNLRDSASAVTRARKCPEVVPVKLLHQLIDDARILHQIQLGHYG